MKIQFKKMPKTVEVNTLDIGRGFIWNKQAFVIVDNVYGEKECIWVLDIFNNKITYFQPDTEVEQVDLEVFVYA